MKRFKGIAAVIADIAQRKKRAAETRFGRTPTEAGEARAVYLAGCSATAEDLAGEGFVFRKSGPGYRRSRGEIVDEILFQSSPYNVAGEYVELSIHLLGGK